MALLDDYRTCADIAKANSRTFYAAFGQLPPPKRDAVYAVYAFCRRCDDVADDPSPKYTLSEVERDLLSMLDSGRSDDPVFNALGDSFARFELDPAPFHEIIEGQRTDLCFRQPETLDELLRYCYLVAGTVGLMILPVLASANASALRGKAIDLGEAMQITNILRDVGEDLGSGRIYLPADLLARRGLDRPALVAMKECGRIGEGFKLAWEELAALAEEDYGLFLESLDGFDRDARLAVCSAAMGYRAILGAVRDSGYDCLTARRSVADFESIRKKAIETVGALEAGE